MHKIALIELIVAVNLAIKGKISSSYFMVRVNIPLTQTSLTLLHYSSFICLCYTQCWSIWVGSFHYPSISTVVYLSNGLTQAIITTTLSNRLTFFSTYLGTASPPHRFRDFPSIPYWVLIGTSKRQYHSWVFWIWSGILLFVLLLPI